VIARIASYAPSDSLAAVARAALDASTAAAADSRSPWSAASRRPSRQAEPPVPITAAAPTETATRAISLARIDVRRRPAVSSCLARDSRINRITLDGPVLALPAINDFRLN
jgi:hypothetical protein